MSFDARRTGRTAQDHVQEIERDFDSDPEDFVYYVTYSETYHTDPDCTYLEGSESVHCARTKHGLSEIYGTGGRDARQLEECSLCASEKTEETD